MKELKKWDLVYISDSTGWGVADKLAENIERDTGKEVTTHNYAVGDLSALQVLEAFQIESDSLENDIFKSLKADISEAEMIVFFANPRGDPSKGGVEGGIEHCIRLEPPPYDCTLELYEPYIENLKAVYEEMLALRNGKPTVIRGVDFYNPLISLHRDRNMEAECTDCLEIFNTAVRQAADTFNIPIVSVYDAFNGPNHDQDPRAKGYIGNDGVHTSEKGQQVIADLLSQAGYEPIEPPPL
ncbi:MAG: SGNH/GDSL hydrolase family protein [Anaerolineales bacterium]